jgi:hypothetical protein
MVVSVKTDETAKGKDSAASHFPRAEVEESHHPESRSNHGPCAIGLESTRFESRTNNGEHMGLDRWMRRASRGQNTWSQLISVSVYHSIKLLRQILWALEIEL